MTETLASKFTIRDDFPAVGYDEWRALVEDALQGAPFERKLVSHTYEGLDLQPIYSRRDELGPDHPLGFPGFAPFIRGSRPLGASQDGWDLRQEYVHPDLQATNREITEDLAEGGTSLLLRLDAAARHGWDPDQEDAAELVGQGGIMAYSVDDLATALAGVQLDQVAIALDAGAAFLPATALLVGLWQQSDIGADSARGTFHADPLAALARTGRLPQAPAVMLEWLAKLAAWTSDQYPHVTAVGVDSSPYHDAGASAAQDIAFAMATAVEYLRAMTGSELSVASAARQITFRMNLGTHHFLAIAKLRAARSLWARVVQVCAGTEAASDESAGAMRIHACTGKRVLTHRDPYVNLLRNTAALFAAGIGGADVMTSVPFDAMTGLPDSFSRRVARNTALILQEEAGLHRIIDPAGGSWFLDQLTDMLADKAWQVFQEVERQGGMLSALQAGWVGREIDAAYAPRAKDIGRRKEGITGVSEFPDIGEEPVSHPPTDVASLREAAARRTSAARQNVAAESAPGPITSLTDAIAAAAGGATVGQIARGLGFHTADQLSITPLPQRTFAEPFERLRDASDAWQAAHGQRPRVFLANMGPIAHHTGRASYSKNFFEAGGFEVVTNKGFSDAEAAAAAFSASGANIAVICSSDKLYLDYVPQVTPQLKAAGARTVILAGHPGDHRAAWEAAGVDRFIFMKCDVLETLRELLHEEGVLEANEVQSHARDS